MRRSSSGEGEQRRKKINDSVLSSLHGDSDTVILNHTPDAGCGKTRSQSQLSRKDWGKKKIFKQETEKTYGG